MRFALASSSEFNIDARVCWKGRLNYQGEATVSFQTMCYGYELNQFEAELRKLAQGGAESARFLNSGEDFEIRIAPHEQKGERILLTELRYRHYYRTDGDVPCDIELVLPVGVAEDVLRTAQAIHEVIRYLKVDCRNLFELSP